MQGYSHGGRRARPMICGLVALISAIFPWISPSTAAPGEAAQTICTRAAAQTEATQGLPTLILGAISLAETGRWDHAQEASFARPWTVTSGSDARYLATKAAAIAVVEAMQTRGVTNIDVGCMQINLGYHPDALAKAFDPLANAAYAGRFILQLQDTQGSRSHTIASYHSSTRKYGLPYLKRVQRLWMTERRRLAELERDTRMEEYKAQKPALAQTISSVATFDVLPGD